MQPKQKILVVAGPTASGKTAAGIALCQRFGGEVVSADSMQIYKHLTVGTAKPTPEEQQRVPHHLIDFLEPSENYSVAQYLEDARRAIADIASRGKLPVIVGGTGLYISSLVDNLQFADEPQDDAIRQRLWEEARQQGAQAVWERLRQVDPASAAAIHPNNQGRVIRALEVWERTGVPMSVCQQQARSTPSPYEPLMLALTYRDRQALYRRIDLRVDIMAQNGLLEEARWLWEQGLASTSGQAIAYKELWDWVKGEEELPAALDRVRQNSRRYAKRQLTWFRRDERYHWYYPDDYAAPQQLYEAIFPLVAEFLEEKR